MRRLTYNQIEKLLSNKNVIGINRNCCIIYNPIFKLWAVEQKIKYPYLTARIIFESAGFDINVIGIQNARKLITSWKNLYYEKGRNYFYKEIDLNNKRQNYRNHFSNIPKYSNNNLEDIVKENNRLLKLILVRFEKILNLFLKK